MIPQWLARRAARHVRWDDDYMVTSAVDLTWRMLQGALDAGFHLVKFDPATEPGERPIVLVDIRPDDLVDRDEVVAQVRTLVANAGS